MVDSAYTLYPAPFRGPSQESVDNARKTLKELDAAIDDQRKRAALKCEACDGIDNISAWTIIEIWNDSFGPYEREKFLSHHMLQCPGCEFRHRLGWSGDLDKYMIHMKREREGHDD